MERFSRGIKGIWSSSCASALQLNMCNVWLYRGTLWRWWNLPLFCSFRTLALSLSYVVLFSVDPACDALFFVLCLICSCMESLLYCKSTINQGIKAPQIKCKCIDFFLPHKFKANWENTTHSMYLKLLHEPLCFYEDMLWVYPCNSTLIGQVANHKWGFEYEDMKKQHKSDSYLNPNPTGTKFLTLKPDRKSKGTNRPITLYLSQIKNRSKWWQSKGESTIQNLQILLSLYFFLFINMTYGIETTQTWHKYDMSLMWVQEVRIIDYLNKNVKIQTDLIIFGLDLMKSAHNLSDTLEIWHLKGNNTYHFIRIGLKSSWIFMINYILAKHLGMLHSNLPGDINIKHH